MEKYLIKKPGNDKKKAKVDTKSNAAKLEESSDEEKTEDDLDHSKSLKQKSAASFTLKEVKGDLFGCPSTESLAHCISEDVRMGKGIAKIFKEKFGGTKELLSQGVNPGGVAVLKRGQRYIYYMVTKQKYWHKPTYDSLRKSLQATMDHCQSHGVRALSMPRIGCGLDGLRWERVVQIIEDTFRETDISVTVYTL